ncbi:hypothetical protein RCL_jg13864.t1 [Rhizophagus clarus]|uniref:Uncharacterized protein n=1 Tax=Rhizophagus clarus TaxID=94130 RepID=A0A8H3LUP7_9GLOM|nr:hypothetical protein RCL_jg13864.t1 [Rhizophagus clarus]
MSNERYYAIFIEKELLAIPWIDFLFLKLVNKSKNGLSFFTVIVEINNIPFLSMDEREKVTSMSLLPLLSSNDPIKREKKNGNKEKNHKQWNRFVTN